MKNQNKRKVIFNYNEIPNLLLELMLAVVTVGLQTIPG